MKLMGYDFEIHYKPGKDKLVADALSRVVIPVVMSFSIKLQHGLMRLENISEFMNLEGLSRTNHN